MVIQTYRKAHLALLIVAVAALPVTAARASQLTAPLTVARAIDTAIRDNPSLAQIQARSSALAEVPDQVASLPDPIVTIGAMNFPTDTFNRAQEPMTQLQVGISQAFPFPGKLSLRQEIAEHTATAAAHSVAEARLQLIRQVKQKWWQLYYIDRAIETVDRNQGLLQQLIEVARTKYETGRGLQQDVLLAQLELSKLIDQTIQLSAIRKHQDIGLNTLMDAPPYSVIVLPDEVSRETPELAASEKLFARAQETRPLLRKLHTELEAARSRLALAKRDYYPDFNVGLVHGDRTGSNPAPLGGDRSDFLSVMVGIKIPLYAGSKQSSAVTQRGLELQSSRYALLDERSLVSSAIEIAVTDYQRARSQLALFEHGIVPQAEQTVESMLAGYQVSEVDFLNLVRSQMTLLNYELQYWKALSDAKQALAELEASVGQDDIYE